jgi:hypothetical protein
MACPFRYDDDDASMEMENEDGAENLNPNISTVDDTTSRKRDLGLRGRTFRFSGICTEFTFSNSSLHDRIREFNRDVGRRFLVCKGNHDPLKWISYVVLSYESSQLCSAETCDVPVIGYIQSTRSIYAKLLQKWMGSELEWRLVPGGLHGYPEFTTDIQNSGDERVKYTVFGKLGMNNLGKNEVIAIIFLMSTSAIGTATLSASHFLYQAADEKRKEDLRTRSESGSVRPKGLKSNSSDCSFSSQSKSASCSSPHSRAEPPLRPQSKSASSSSPDSRAEPRNPDPPPAPRH